MAKSAEDKFVRGKDLTTVGSEVKSKLSLKQDNIADLQTIRSGAALGATALQYTPVGEIDPSITPADYATREELNLCATKAEVNQLGQELLNDITGTIISGSGINVSGVISSITGSQRTDYIDLTGMSYIYVTNPNNVKLEYDVFYDSSKAFISGSRFEVPANTAFHRVAVPSTAKYCIVSVRNNGTMPTVYGESIVPDLKNAQEDISVLQSNVTKCVRFDSQSLSASEKTQARTNIGAAKVSVETDIAKFVTGEYINTGSINAINTPGGYYVGASVTDIPGAGGGYLFVVASNSRFIQKYFFHASGNILYYGVIDTNTNLMLIDWQAINKAPLNSTGNSTTDAISQKAATDYVDNPNRPYTTSGSVNALTKTGGYYVSDAVQDLPEPGPGSVIVTPTFSNGRFVHQKFTSTTTGNIYERIIDVNHLDTPVFVWSLINPRAEMATFGKNIVCFGDSIFGNYDGASGASEGVVSFMHRYGYANTFNCAFGGTTASLRNITYWDDMSFTALVDAIISGDWTAQDYAIAHSTEFPAAFATHLATLKAIDWSAIDIVTVAFGTNDFGSNKQLGDNTINKNTYTGALLYGISKLQEEFPHIKVIILSPCWRWVADASGYYDYDSDTAENTLGLKLTDYVDAALELADIIHIPGCDNYHKLGITKYNYTGYFNTGDNADGTHHALNGRKTLAHRIVAFINANC